VRAGLEMHFRSQGAGFRKEIGVLLLVAVGCAPSIAPLPTPVPTAPAPVPATPAPVVPRVALPSRMSATTWRVSSVARLKASGAGVSGDEQRVESRALVSWTLTRAATGGLRGTGQVDSFTVVSSLDTTKSAPRGAATAMMPAMLLIEATVDSAIARVSTRPPLANECDRPEASAATLARDLLVRIPDGAAANDRWRDSTATLVCRSGVPMVVYTTIWSTLESLGSDKLVLKREITTKLEGKGGSAFRALELAGTGTGTQRAEVRVSDGSVSKLEGSSTLTLQLKESTPPAPAKSSQLVQRTEFRAERVSR
jgi:hypothetical protein